MDQLHLDHIYTNGEAQSAFIDSLFPLQSLKFFHLQSHSIKDLSTEWKRSKVKFEPGSLVRSQTYGHALQWDSPHPHAPCRDDGYQILCTQL